MTSLDVPKVRFLQKFIDKINAPSTLRMRNLKMRFHSEKASVHITPEKFENATITSGRNA